MTEQAGALSPTQTKALKAAIMQGVEDFVDPPNVSGLTIMPAEREWLTNCIFESVTQAREFRLVVEMGCGDMKNDLRRQGEGDWEAFKRGVDAAFASVPKRRAKSVDHPFLSLLAETRRLVDEARNDAFGPEHLRGVVQRLNKCAALKLNYKAASLTGKAVIVFEPTDTFQRLVCALRARDWQRVALIEHDIISS